jgi:hypothetical protein
MTQSRHGVNQAIANSNATDLALALGAHNSGRRHIGGARGDETACSARTIKAFERMLAAVSVDDPKKHLVGRAFVGELFQDLASAGKNFFSI